MEFFSATLQKYSFDLIVFISFSFSQNSSIFAVLYFLTTVFQLWKAYKPD